MTREEQDFLEKLLKLENGILILEVKNIFKIYVLKTNITVINYLYNRYNSDVLWLFICKNYKLRNFFNNLENALLEAKRLDDYLKETSNVLIHGIQHLEIKISELTNE
jgi:hypothetical protein